MATDFKQLAFQIYQEIYTRVNIGMYEAEGAACSPADVSTGLLRVTFTSDELKQLAGLKRMRKQYSSKHGKGGFYPRLLAEFKAYEQIHAYELNEKLVVIYIHDLPNEIQHEWSHLVVKNELDMKENKKEVEQRLNADHEEFNDYRYCANIRDLKFREWDIKNEDK